MVYASLARRRVVRKAPQLAAEAAAAKAAHPCAQPRAPDGPVKRERGSRLAEAVEVSPNPYPLSLSQGAASRFCSWPG